MTIQELQTQADEGKLSGLYSCERIPIDIYHAQGSPGISVSGLKMFMKYPKLYHSVYMEGNPTHQTPEMLFGQMVHEAVLEPEKFDAVYISDYQQIKKGARTSKAYKQAVKEYMDDPANSTKKFIKHSTYDAIQRIRDAINKHPVASNVFKDGVAEQTAFCTDTETGVLKKCRFDYLRDDGFIPELKTTSDASRFENIASSLGYHIQTSWYETIAEMVLGKHYKMLYIVIEKDYPHGIRCCVMDSNAVALGYKKWTEALKQFKYFLNKNEWPMYLVDKKETIEEIQLPAWIYHKEGEE